MQAPSTDIYPATTRPSRNRRRVIWAGCVLLALLILALIPPLLNVSRLQRRIAASMSASLGRPVHLDRASVHLLPVPGFTLENLVVSEDPAFGYEPTIRANIVEATLRPSSLWRRQVEFSTIRFIEPSLNLVRNKQGKWNLQTLMLHAANASTAPTAQRKAGPTPRFPYIEATGARVNLKLGDEKLPFSLTEADFALWLPTPAQWRVRLEGKPARTDTNVSDPGVLRLEGSLERAATMADVPVDLRASWRGAPLGEATRLLSGEDAGWRGNLILESTLQGKLGEAKLETKLHIEDLRRADRVPEKSLDLIVECSGTLETMTAVVHTPACSLPAEKLTAVADRIDLTNREATGLRLGTPGMREDWLLDWARLFSERIPEKKLSGGLIAGTVAIANPGRGITWQGEASGDLDPLLPWGNAKMVPTNFSVTSDGKQWTLQPVNLLIDAKSPPLLFDGVATGSGYTLRIEGLATAKQMQALLDAAPPLGDGIENVMPAVTDIATAKPEKIALTCTRPWGGIQTCTVIEAEPAKRTARRR